jgi:hypothetical protein
MTCRREKVFARGVEYDENGKVEIVRFDKALLPAGGSGSEVYRKWLNKKSKLGLRQHLRSRGAALLPGSEPDVLVILTNS